MDKTEARKAALEKKEEAKQKIALAKKEAIKAKAQKKSPVFYEMPEPTGDPEIDSAADLSALEEGFRAKIKNESKRFELATDTEYWACLCFQTREQKEHFLAALNILQCGDKYLDGQEVADILKIKIPAADLKYNTGENTKNHWEEFTKKGGEKT